MELSVYPFKWEMCDVIYRDPSIIKNKKKYSLGDCNNGFEIRAWSWDINNEPVLVRLLGFPPYMYLELPTIVSGVRKAWDKEDVLLLHGHFSFKMSSSPIAEKLERRKPLYYYRSGKKKTLLRVHFNTIQDLYRFGKDIKKTQNVKGIGVCNFKVWEKDIKQDKKLHVVRKISNSMWCKITGSDVEEKYKVSRGREIICFWDDIEPTEEDFVPSPLLLCFDFETQSTNFNRFPNPERAGDYIFMASCIIKRYMGETKARIVLVVGDYDVDLEDVEVIKCENELDLIRRFENLFIEYDPDVITNYNGLTFDFRYLISRLARMGKKLSPIGRLLDPNIKIHEDNWESSGYGKQDRSYPILPGRIHIDMFVFMKRQYGKLNSYKLDYVGNEFLGKGKSPVSPKMMFKTVAVQNATRDAEDVQEFFRYEDKDEMMIDFGDPYFRRTGKKIVDFLPNMKDSIIESSEFIGKDPRMYEIWRHAPIEDGVARRDVARFWFLVQEMVKEGVDIEKIQMMFSKFAGYRKTLETMNQVIDYCDRDSVLVVELFELFSVWTNIDSSARIFQKDHESILLTGQQNKFISQLYTEVVKNGYFMMSIPSNGVKIEGGYVFEPIAGRHKYGAVNDFNSEYPSVILQYNICYTTYVPESEWKNVPEDKCNIIKGYNHEEPFEHRFVKEEYLKGILPIRVEQLLSARKLEKKEMNKHPEGSLKHTIHNANQLALKVGANSVYGFISVGENGSYPLDAGGMCITFKGRDMIQECARFAETYEGIPDHINVTIPGGDTDSYMPAFTGSEDFQEITALANELSEKCTERFGDYIVMETERIASFLFLKRKNYAYLQYDKEGNLSKDYKKVKGKGMTERRDYCPWAKDTLLKLFFLILTFSDFKTVYTFLIDEMQKIVTRQYDHENFILTKKFSGSYAGDNFPMKLFGERLLKEGHRIQADERLHYLVVKQDQEYEIGKSGRKKKKKQYTGDSYYLPEEYEKQDCLLEVDYFHYIEKNFAKRAMAAVSSVEDFKVESDRIGENCKRMGHTACLCPNVDFVGKFKNYYNHRQKVMNEIIAKEWVLEQV